MKRFRLSLLLIVLMSMVGLSAWADGFEVATPGYSTLHYSIVSPSDKTVEVVAPDNGDYESVINIPETITYEGINFTVVGVKKLSVRSSYFTSITFPPSIKYFGEGAFAHLHLYNEFEIPNTVTSIGRSALAYTSGITNIVIPNSVVEIGDYAFEDCVDLENVILPNGITEIGNWAFADNSKLKTIEIPDNVSIIHDNAFSKCQLLQTIILPKNLQTISSSAFSECDQIRNITSKSSWIGCCFVSENAFTNNVKMFATLTVPEDCETRYTNNGWGDFTKIQEDSSLPVQYAITLASNEFDSAGGFGSFEFNGSSVGGGDCHTYAVDKGDPADLTITPNKGYKIATVTDNGNDVTQQLQNNTYTLTDVNADHDISVTFELNTYTLTINCPDLCEVRVNAIDYRSFGNTINEGDNLHLEIYSMAAYGGDFKSIKVNGEEKLNDYNTNNGYLDINDVSSDIIVDIDFEAITPYTFTVNDYGYTADCSIFVNGNDLYYGNPLEFPEGDNVTVEVNYDDTSVKVKSIKVNGNVVASGDDVTNPYTWTVTGLSANQDIELEVVRIGHVWANYNDNVGKVSVNGHEVFSGNSYDVAVGENVTISFVPNDGYDISYVDVNGEDKTEEIRNIGGTYSTTMPEDGISVNVYFNPAFTLDVTYNNGGRVEIDGGNIASGSSHKVNGTDAYVYVQADEGCEIASVLYNGEEQLSSRQTSFDFYPSYTNGSNQTLVVTFSRSQCYVTTNISGNGTLTIGGVNQGNGEVVGYAPDQDLTVTFTPAAGWQVASADIDGQDITSEVQGGSYTIKQINANKTINVTFVPVSLAFSNRYMTFCSPVGVDLRNNNDVKAWTVTGYDGTKIHLTRVEIVPAGKGVLLEAAEGTTWAPVTTNDQFYMANLLVGTLNAISLDTYEYNMFGDYCHNFIFSNGSKGLGFYPLSNGGTLAAGKAYLPIPEWVVSSARGAHFTLDFEDNVSNGVESIGQDNKEGTVYSVSGMRVANPKKGLYIKNGKKIVVK